VSQAKATILIVGNELSMGETLKNALVKEGYEVFYVLHPDEAPGIIHSHRIDVMMVDCMLPRISGVDFVEQFKNNFPSLKIQVVLMSAIYTDKAFIQEAIKKTAAVAFIKKEMPFDISAFLEVLNKMSFASHKKESSARRTLYQIFSKDKVTNREKRKVIESLEEVTGFDLPFIYSLLIETKSSGYLNIYEKDGSVSGISFSSGTIVGVDTEDKATIFGELVIQSGYASPENVKYALEEKSNLRLGQRLIKGNLLSPHAFDLVLAEQMNVRLSRTITERQIKVNFAATEVDPSSPCIDSEMLLPYLHDWIVSKLSVNWLKGLYTMWNGHTIQKTAAFRRDHPALKMSLFNQMNRFVEEVDKGTTISKLLAIQNQNESAVYKGLHFLLTKGLISFSSKVLFNSPQEQLEAIRKLSAEFAGKSPFEILHFLDIAPDDPRAAVQEFLSIIGPEPAVTNKDLLTAWNGIRKQFEETVKNSQDTSLMDQLKKANETKAAELKLRASQTVEEVKSLLMKNLFQRAFDKMSEAMKHQTHIPYGNTYLAWSKLGLAETTRKPVNLKEVEYDLLQVPAEEKYEIHYLYVQGLFQKAKGDFIQARRSFEKAIAIDGSFIPARREISMLDAQKKEKTDILNMDLKQVVSGFFKKRA
jgi:CheY-like chemotaxis protein/tetratricopeptide (TPR) repeat protein